MTLLMLSLPPAAAGADAPFNPDRPGTADSAGSVPAGRLLTEAGVTVARQDGPVVLDAPQLLVRGGLTDRLELRVSAPSVALPLGDSGALAAAAGGAVGLKWATALGAEAALSAVAMLPVAAGPLDDALGAPGLTLNAARAVRDVGVTLNAAASPGEVLDWAASLAAGYHALYAQAVVEGTGAALSPLVGAGAAITPLPALQLDVFVDVQPASGALLAGAGVARQW